MLKKKLSQYWPKSFTFLGYLSVVCFCLSSTVCVKAMVDNRFFVPFINHTPFLTEQVCTTFSVQPLLMTANNSYNETGSDSPLFDYGSRDFDKYKLRELDKALETAGITTGSLLPTNMQGLLTSGPYLMNGRLEAQGFGWNWYEPITDNWAFGARSSLLHVNSRMELSRDLDFDSVINGPGDERDIFLAKEAIHKALGVEPGLWSSTMLGDLEVYGRLFSSQNYKHRCRYLDAGLAVGLIVPMNSGRDVNNPASIPVGANGHWGVFFEPNIDAVLRQDLRAGISARFQQRFSRTHCMRVPVGLEPEMFGAVVGDISVNPGFTLAVSPYVLFEAIRGGLGLRVGYTLVKHWKDYFSDRRRDQSVPFKSQRLADNSKWAIEHVSLGFVYDFAQGKKVKSFEPVISFNIDAPVEWIVSRRSFKTYGVSLAIEASF